MSTPDPLVDRLAAIPYPGALSDILDEMGFREQVLPPEIRPLDQSQRIAGRALTAIGEPATGLERDEYFRPFLKMLGEVGPGDIIVSQPNDLTVAHFGELSAETAQFRGGRGAIIDGGCRDIDYITKLGFPVFCRYVTPKDIGGRWRLLSHNVPIHIGGVAIRPGDYLAGDRDGVLVIPQEAAEEAVTQAEAVVNTENVIRKEILEGATPLEAYDRHGRF